MNHAGVHSDRALLWGHRVGGATVLCVILFSSILTASAQLKINEVYYNVTPQGGNQYVELYNPGSSNLFLDGMIITDEGGTGLEGVYKFPGDPGETNYSVTPGGFVVIAVDGKDATSNANWECYAGGADSDNPAVPNLDIVDGVTDLALYGNGDNVILADGTDTNAPIDQTSIVDGMNYAGGGGELAALSSTTSESDSSISSTTNASLGRCPEGYDNDTATSYDFTEMPLSPGSANACSTPFITIDDLSLNEGDSGSSPAIFTLSVQPTPTQDVSVTLSTLDGTASAGTDYSSVGATSIVFNAGFTQSTFTVSVIGDVAAADDETFYINLASPTNLAIPDAQALGTILNDDGSSAFSIDDSSVLEGDVGATSIFFTVVLAPPSESSAQVTYGTADGSAVESFDYIAAGGVLPYSIGETSKTFSILIIGDTEADTTNEEFYVNLSAASGAGISDDQATGYIIDNDGEAIVSVANTNILEGDGGTTSMVFTISLSKTNATEASVNFATSNGTALAGSDYTAVSVTTIVFSVGITERTVSIDVIGDTLSSSDETFFAVLSSPTNLKLFDTLGDATILNDDGSSMFSIDDPSVDEGNSGTTNLTFTISLSPASENDTSANFMTSNDTAQAGVDYTEVAVTTLLFSAASTEKTIDVTIFGDTTPESDLTFFGMLSSASNAGISDAQGTATILNDDLAATVTVANASTFEGDTGSTSITFHIVLSGVPSGDASINYTTADDTAVAPGDYQSIAVTTVVFSGGATSALVEVTVVSDTAASPDESFFLNLSDPSNLIVGVSQGVGTIYNDDATSVVSIADSSVSEGSAGTVDLVFTSVLTVANEDDVAVDFDTSDNTAVDPDDYLAVSTTILFTAGSVSETVAVPAVGDQLAAADETFFADISAPSNAVLGDAQAVGTILNDDGTASVTISDESLIEGDTGSTDLTFTLTMLPAAESAASVTYATADNTALSATDYVAVAATPYIFTSGETSTTVNVSIAGDGSEEPDETFFVNLTSPTNAAIGDSQGIGTIVNDDDDSFTLAISYDLSGTIATVSWDSVVSETYFIQFSTNLYTAPWSNLTSVVASGSTSTASDVTGAATSRYYRGLRE